MDRSSSTPGLLPRKGSASKLRTGGYSSSVSSLPLQSKAAPLPSTLPAIRRRTSNSSAVSSSTTLTRSTATKVSSSSSSRVLANTNASKSKPSWSKTSLKKPIKGMPAGVIDKQDVSVQSLRHVLNNKSTRLINEHDDLRAHFTSLELVNISFSQMIENLGVNRPMVANLLRRIRDTYRHLFQQLINTLITLESEFREAAERALKLCDETKLELEADVSAYRERVRVLTRVSMAKDAVLNLTEENTSQLELEMDDLRELLMSKVSDVPRTSWPRDHAKKGPSTQLTQTNASMSQLQVIADLSKEQVEMARELDQEFQGFDVEVARANGLLNDFDVLLDGTNPDQLRDVLGKGYFKKSLVETQNEQLESRWTTATQTEETYTDLGVLVSMYDAPLPTEHLTIREVTGKDTKLDYDAAKQEAKSLVSVLSSVPKPKIEKLELGNNWSKDKREKHETAERVAAAAAAEEHSTNLLDVLTRENKDRGHDEGIPILPVWKMHGHMIPVAFRNFIQNHFDGEKLESFPVQPPVKEYKQPEHRFVNKAVDGEAQEHPGRVIGNKKMSLGEALDTVSRISHEFLYAGRVQFDEFVTQYFLSLSGHSYKWAAQDLIALSMAVISHKRDNPALMAFFDLLGMVQLPLPDSKREFFDLHRYRRPACHIYSLALNWFNTTNRLERSERPFLAVRVGDHLRSDHFGDPLQPGAWLPVHAAQMLHEYIFNNDSIKLANLGWVKKNLRVWIIEHMQSIRNPDSLVSESIVNLHDYMAELIRVWDTFLRNAVKDVVRGSRFDAHIDNPSCTVVAWTKILNILNEAASKQMDSYQYTKSLSKLMVALSANPYGGEDFIVDSILRVLDEYGFWDIKCDFLDAFLRTRANERKCPLYKPMQERDQITFTVAGEEEMDDEEYEGALGLPIDQPQVTSSHVQATLHHSKEAKIEEARKELDEKRERAMGVLPKLELLRKHLHANLTMKADKIPSAFEVEEATRLLEAAAALLKCDIS